jgi:hypothetical protein
VAQVVERLSSKREALSSNPNTAKEKKKYEEKMIYLYILMIYLKPPVSPEDYSLLASFLWKGVGIADIKA